MQLDDARRLELLQEIADAAGMRAALAAAIVGAGPEAPFDAGVIDAERRADEEDQREERSPPGRGAVRERQDDQRRARAGSRRNRARAASRQSLHGM